MGQPAAKRGDTVVGIDTHIVILPNGATAPLPHPFNGILQDNLSGNVNIMKQPAATVGSIANNTPPHIPTPPGVSFQKPPSNKSQISMGSTTVKINGKQAARNLDPGRSCNDPVDQDTTKVVAVGTVFIGG